MTIQSTTILDTLDEDLASRLVSRRDALVKGGVSGATVLTGLRMASVPVALAAMANTAFAQGRLPAAVNAVLNFALVLEYLEAEFYNIGMGTAGLIPTIDREIFGTIQDHENAHVAFLRTTLGRSARPKPTFDFTAGNGSGTGPFADVFSNYATFMAVAQAFEDTGVRAYKGQAPTLQPYKDVLQAALTIHSVEARHASEVRRLRGNFTDVAPNKGWITGDMTDISGTAAVYAGEDNIIHGGVNAVAVTSVSTLAVTEAYDEPLTMKAVLAIVDPFIV